ncbi:hypothetical protein M0R45_015777 [Rubus argutus]|uniref:Peptidase A1 domain-containing protein n=1 Tax=Rubus argutus TaxID=59490 RepID=A0AAW1XQR0_RUBAR
MRFHFKGGADMALPPENQYVDGGDVICMALMNVDDAFSSGNNGTELAWSGPSIVLGSFQMQNFYLEYDVRSQRLGFRQQKCN